MNIKQQNYKTSATRVDMKLEVEIVPVSDVERSKRFYHHLGWRLDDDVSPVDGVRIVQFTPPAQRAQSRSARESRRPRLARPRVRWSSPTSKRPMTTSSA